MVILKTFDVLYIDLISRKNTEWCIGVIEESVHRVQKKIEPFPITLPINALAETRILLEIK